MSNIQQNVKLYKVDTFFYELKDIIINKEIIMNLLKNHYNDIIQFKAFIKNLISSNSTYEQILTIFCIANDDVNILKLLINKTFLCFMLSPTPHAS